MRHPMLATAVGTALLAVQAACQESNTSFIDPRTQGGSFLSRANDGLGEPMNVTSDSSSQ